MVGKRLPCANSRIAGAYRRDYKWQPYFLRPDGGTVDTLSSGGSAERHVSSNLTLGTKFDNSKHITHYVNVIAE